MQTKLQQDPNALQTPERGECHHGGIVTLVIHGTFAAEEAWWRLGTCAQPKFADRLEQALQSRGVKGPLWKPALEFGFGYSKFQWSGENSHSERVKAARKLADSVEALASKFKASATVPLDVVLVAHSHGGNVALEALRNWPTNARLCSLVLLGTPFIVSVPSARIVRLYVASVVIGLIGTLLLWVTTGSMLLAGMLIFAGIESPAKHIGNEETLMWGSLAILAAFCSSLVSYGWFGWLICFVFDCLWQAFRLFQRGSGWVYGPSPKRLVEILGKVRVHTFSSPLDEASTGLSTASEIKDRYEEWMRIQPAGTRWMHFIFFRPLVSELVIKVAEMFLEKAVFGFSWLQLLNFDYELSNPAGKHRLLFDDVDVTPMLTREMDLQKSHISDSATPQLGKLAEAKAEEAFARSRLDILLETIRNLRRQIRLVHNSYHQSHEIVEAIAEKVVEDLRLRAAR